MADPVPQVQNPLAQAIVDGLVQVCANDRARRDERSAVTDLVNQTTKCDGLSTAATRNWIREIELAFQRVGQAHIISIVSKTVTGPLRFEIERVITAWIANPNNNLANREVVPWGDLRQHISEAFLNIDEAAALRDEVDKLKQSTYETIAAYSRRFREVADAAYPVGQRNADQHRILVKAYAKGLQSNTIARKLVEEGDPQELEQAITMAARLSERRHAYDRLGREEEPMEVGHITKAPEVAVASAVLKTSLEEKLEKLLSSQEKIHTRIAKLEARGTQSQLDRQPRRNAAQASSNRPPAWNSEGQPRCFNCNMYGHYARECSRQSGNAHPPQQEGQ